MIRKLTFTVFLLMAALTHAVAEDGHALWLRMTQNTENAKVVTAQYARKRTAVMNTAVTELQHYWRGGTVTLQKADGNDEAYTIAMTDGGVTLSASTDRGLLYGVYDLLRRQQTGALPAAGEVVREAPVSDLRILNHWDNPNGTCERGFAGRSIFWRPGGMADLNILKDYARACASIGINATVLNNVNAKPEMLSKAKLNETKRIADALRPYGMRVYLAVNFASPKALGDLNTADPLDAKVQQWWKKKAGEIYKMIPDFGGFLVKANSEGEPGPMDYGRTHVDGANMLADALQPYGGIVMWRAFVYSPKSKDRASQAYDEFVPFDGQFRSNVIIQIKNGPVDFQPREPVSPLFFGLSKTQMMPEFQVTQEYLGENVHSVFLAPMWREFFDSLRGAGTWVSKQRMALAGVANIADDVNWCGSVMVQANWYAFGRLAWNENLSSETIAREWLQQTFDGGEKMVATMMPQMLTSREAAVHYMMPLGIHHIFAGTHHYGPEPWYAPKGLREDWLPRYYHKAAADGIGFDRTVATGSGNTRQYPEAMFRKYENIDTCPEQLLLWFHHVPWNHRMHNGETLWEALCHTYDLGIREAEAFHNIWQQMKPYVDAERWAAQEKLFDRQAKDAWWWRDACLLYFQEFSKLPLPLDCPAPRHKLSDLQKFHLDMDMYTSAAGYDLP